MLSAHVIGLAGNEIVNDIGKGPGRVLHIVNYPLVALEYGVGLVEECVVDEFGDESAVGIIMLMRSIAVHRPDPDGLGVEHLGRVHAHQLSGPLGDSIVVHLVSILDGIVDHHIFGHDALIVTVDLSAGEEDHPEF